MSVRFAQWTLDVRDVRRMSHFWSEALGYTVDVGDDGSATLYPPEGAAPNAPTLWLQHTETPKPHKNRNHPDLRPVGGTVEAEVERLLSLGATHVDVGQRADDPFVVLADPEGNEFCILRTDPHRAG